MVEIVERYVGCYSEGVRAIIEELRSEAIRLVPRTVLIEAMYTSPDGTHHAQYDKYTVRTNTAMLNPDTHSVYYQASLKKLVIGIAVNYERLTGRQGKITNGGISFQEVIEKECDLTWVEKIPVDFKVLGSTSRSILVTRKEYRQIVKVLGESKCYWDLDEEYDRRYRADLKRGPLSGFDY